MVKRRPVQDYPPEAFTTRYVLAGAYRGADLSERPLLTHTAWPDSEDAICNRVRAGHLGDLLGMVGDESREPPTCEACRAKDPRFKGLPGAARDKTTWKPAEVPSVLTRADISHSASQGYTPLDWSWLRKQYPLSSVTGKWLTIKLVVSQGSDEKPELTESFASNDLELAKARAVSLIDEAQADHVQIVGVLSRSSHTPENAIYDFGVMSAAARLEPNGDLVWREVYGREYARLESLGYSPPEARQLAADRAWADYAERGGEKAHVRNQTGYYVWVVRGDEPVDGEGPWGPYAGLEKAKTFARIGATEGQHDRAVSIGREPMNTHFQIVRRYESGTGARLI